MLNFWGSSCTVSTADAPFYIPISSAQRFHGLHILVDTCYFLFYFFLVWFGLVLAVPCSTWDLSSPTRDQTRAPCSGSSVLTTGPPGSPSVFFLFFPSSFPFSLSLSFSLSSLSFFFLFDSQLNEWGGALLDFFLRCYIYSSYRRVRIYLSYIYMNPMNP